ncbi:MAG: hypothetical protein HYS23_08110 [Geobacter sp.]|nr:hypothetical protein [Geobacter sp.]
MRRLIIIAITLCAPLLLAAPLPAMDSGHYGEFQQYLQLPVSKLAEKASQTLDEQEDWIASPAFNPADELSLFRNTLPEYVFKSAPIYTAYRIATKKPDILRRYPCYCGCEEQNHTDLLHCFLKDGKAGAYEPHASTCPTCVGEALLVFLWTELGATYGEITGALRLAFDPSVHEPPPFTP